MDDIINKQKLDYLNKEINFITNDLSIQSNDLKKLQDNITKLQNNLDKLFIFVYNNNLITNNINTLKNKVFN